MRQMETGMIAPRGLALSAYRIPRIIRLHLCYTLL